IPRYLMCVIKKSIIVIFFFFSSRRRHTRSKRDWSSDVCSSDLNYQIRENQRGLKDARKTWNTMSRNVQRTSKNMWNRASRDARRSEERRVGKERRAEWGRQYEKRRRRESIRLLVMNKVTQENRR